MSGRIRSLNDFSALLKGVKRARDGQYLALCPGHRDTKPSRDIDKVGAVHILHHTGAIEGLRHTGNPKAVQDQLRHKSVLMTMRYLRG